MFGGEFSAARWNQGFVIQDDKIFLLVTLDKSDMQEEHGYSDAFDSPEIFHWQSQNRTKQESEHGRRIRDHEGRGIPVHLFVRKQKKEKGRAAPFIYCGELEFVSWQGEQPISVTWRMKNPLSDRLYSGLTRQD